MLVAVYTSHYLSLSRARSIQSTPYHSFCLEYILTLPSHPRLGLPSGLFPSGFPMKTVHTASLPAYTCHMPCPSHSPRFYHTSIWRRVQIMKLVTMKFSPVSLPLTRKYLPQHPFLQNLKCRRRGTCTAPRYTVSSSLLLLPPSGAQTYYSALNEVITLCTDSIYSLYCIYSIFQSTQLCNKSIGQSDMFRLKKSSSS